MMSVCVSSVCNCISCGCASTYYIEFIYLFVLEIGGNDERTVTKNCLFGSNIGY